MNQAISETNICVMYVSSPPKVVIYETQVMKKQDMIEFHNSWQQADS